jgi:hypothetical protein
VARACTRISATLADYLKIRKSNTFKIKKYLPKWKTKVFKNCQQTGKRM